MTGRQQIWLVAGLMVVGAGLTVWGATIETPPAEPRQRDQKWIDREAIRLCRERQNDELEELSTRRTFRSMCNQMAADFRQKWGVDP